MSEDVLARLIEAEDRLARCFVVSSPFLPSRADIEEYNRLRSEVEQLHQEERDGKEEEAP